MRAEHAQRRSASEAGMSRAGGVLYVSYDGMLEPLGQSQVLAYLKKLAPAHRIHLLSFEKRRDWEDATLRERIARQITDAGIAWHPLRYHKRPTVLATAYDVAAGILLGAWLVVRYRLRLVHARGDVPSIVAVLLKGLFGTKYLYDIRGFWPDERVDGGLWRRDSLLYRVAKRFERRFMLAADHKVVLAKAAVEELYKMPFLQGRVQPVSVIPTCTDLERFRPLPGTKRPFTLGYVGSVTTWCLLDEVFRSFLALKRRLPEARMRVLNRGEHGYIAERARALGVTDLDLCEADHSQVAAEMAGMDAGVFIRKPLFSQRSSCPTKLGEFLACGVPCLANAGIGDVTEFLEGPRVGVVLREFSDAAIDDAVDRLLALVSEPGIRDRCVRAAAEHFSLDAGVRAYAGIYDALLA